MFRRSAWLVKGPQWLVILMGVVSCALLPAAVVSAAELGVGTQVDLAGGDDLLATIWHYMSGPAGKVLGIGLVWSGLSKTGGETARGNPYVKAVSGAGIAFAPPIVNSAFEHAASATNLLVPGQAVLARILDGFAGYRLVFDPVFYVVLAGVLAFAVYAESRRRRVLAY